jgi:glucose uptake protein GlcU
MHTIGGGCEVTMNQKKNITTIVLASIAIFIYMVFLGTFKPIGQGSILPGAIGCTIGAIVFYVTFGGKFERLLNKIVSIAFGFPIAGLFVGIANYLKVEVTLPILVFSLLLAFA